MLIETSLLILIILTFFSMISGQFLVGTSQDIGIDNTALINGSTSTYVVSAENTLFFIDTSDLIVAGIVLLTTIIIVAGITGIQFLGSGLNVASVRVIILLTGYIGIWVALTTLAYSLITSIQVFGSIIYIGLTLAYVIGVIQKISGNE